MDDDQAWRTTQPGISEASEVRDRLLECFITMTPNEAMGNSAVEQPTAVPHAIEMQLIREHAFILVAQQ